MQELPETDKDRFISRGVSAGFGPQRAALERFVLPAIAFAEEMVDDDAISVAVSKLGGRPALRDPSTWPMTSAGQPLSFIAQFNLREIAELQWLGRELPTDGLLLFFYDSAGLPRGTRVAEASQWRVQYEADVNAVARAEFPPTLGVSQRCKSATLKGVRQWTMPFPDTRMVQRLGLGQELEWNFEELCMESWKASGISLLGHPFPVQGDMQLLCQFVVNGVTDFKNDPRIPDLEAGIEDWRLLLQLPSREQLGMDWDGEGVLYFWIRKQGLENRNFNGVWLQLQTG